MEFNVIGVIFENGRGFQLAVICPFCGTVHIHGDGFGGRSAHCGKLGIPDYCLVRPPNDTVDSALRDEVKKRLRGRGFDLEKPKTLLVWYLEAPRD